MKNIIIYGPGCKRCEATEKMVRDAAAKLGVDVDVSKQTDYAEIAMAGVVSTPGIAIDGKLVHAGGLPDETALEAWLKA